MASNLLSAGSLSKKASDEEKKREGIFQRVEQQIAPATAALKYIYSGEGTRGAEAQLTRTRRAATTGAFRDARRGATLRARRAGFGYNQPLFEGSQGYLDRAEASEMSRIPGESKLAMMPYQLQAAQGMSPFMNTMAGMGAAYSPYQYYQIAMQKKMSDNQAKQSMWGNIAGLGGTTISAIAL